MNVSQVILFAGAGHAHLHSLQHVRDLIEAGAQVTVVAPGPFWYSGMGPGMLSGEYSTDEDTVDVQSLVEQQGGHFIAGRVMSVNGERRICVLEDETLIHYDLLSLNVGSEVSVPASWPQAAERIIPVKPVSNLARARSLIQTLPETVRILVIGGGAAGVEVAMNAEALNRQEGFPSVQVTLVSSAEQLVESFPEKASDLLRQQCRQRDIHLQTGAKVQTLQDRLAILEDGSEIPFDLAFIATGVRPPQQPDLKDLETSPDGALTVDQYLRSRSHPHVFGGGDGIFFQPQPLPRVGVHAVRQGQVLYKNLLASLRNQPLTPYHPQNKYLLILNMGDGTGLLHWRGFVIRARWAFRLKDFLDRRFRRAGGSNRGP